MLVMPGHVAREFDNVRVAFWQEDLPQNMSGLPVAGKSSHSSQEKLVPTRLRDRSPVVGISGSELGPNLLDCFQQLILSCPHLDVCIGGVNVSCLIDTGSVVSTIRLGALRLAQ